MEEEIKPHIEDWIEAGAYPLELHEKAYKAGIQGISYPKEFGGTPPEKYDAFYELIAIDEIARVGGGSVLGKKIHFFSERKRSKWNQQHGSSPTDALWIRLLKRESTPSGYYRFRYLSYCRIYKFRTKTLLLGHL